MAEIRSNAASVEFRNVTKIYGNSKTPAVNDISLSIEAGKLVTLLGPSGCGKTTTLRMIAGLEMATGGQILIGGADVTRAAGDRPRRLHGVPVLRAVSAHDGDARTSTTACASPASPRRRSPTAPMPGWSWSA